MGTQMLAKANAIMKRLRSTETLGSTSAINSDKTGTLTLNQMTAVEMAIPGRKYTISGTGYSTEGTIKHVAGEEEVPLDQFLMPMVLAADAVVTDAGEMIGDPTEGALVVLAEKGGLDAESTRAAFPRIAELPFDTDVQADGDLPSHAGRVGQGHRPCLREGRARPAARPRHRDARLEPRPAHLDDELGSATTPRTSGSAAQGLRVLATARKDFEPEHLRPQRRPAGL